MNPDPDLAARAAELMARFKAADRSWMSRNQPAKAPAIAAQVSSKKARIAQNYRTWCALNPDRRAAKEAKRRAAVRAAVPENYNHLRVLEMFKWSKRLTHCLGVKFHLDHIVALAAGGHHNYDNLRPIPAKWNQVKNADDGWAIPRCWVDRTIET